MSEPGKYRRFADAEVLVAAPPAAVWAGWSEPEQLAGWLPERVSGRTQAGELVTWHYDHIDHHLTFRVEEARPPARLVLHEHAPAGPPLGYKVELEAEGEGTRCRVRGYGVPPGEDPDEMADCAAAGLTLSLHRMKRYLERHPGRTRRHLLEARPARFDYADLLPHVTTVEGLRGWLGELGGAGGEVLVATAHDVMRSWDEIHGVLEVRAFPTGKGPRMVSVRVSSWPPAGAPRTLLPERAVLAAAVDRLVARLAPPAPAGHNG